MIAPARGFAAFRTYLEMIKIEHSIFALPFALIGMMWGSISLTGGAWPGASVFFWIVLAMVSCRSAAMAFNRIADRHIDAKNPRTALRALPAGLLQLRHANLFFLMSCAIFVLSAAMLNPLSLALSPVALLITLGYSLSKRITWLCHILLGISLGIAPAAAWIAVSSQVTAASVALLVGVMFWTAGFDVIYALQDDSFDSQEGLNSIPARFGRVRALQVSRTFHILAVVSLAAAGHWFGAGSLWFVGLGLASGLLIYEQSLVRPNDLSRVDIAFFTLNGFVSLGLLLFAVLDVIF